MKKSTLLIFSTTIALLLSFARLSYAQWVQTNGPYRGSSVNAISIDGTNLVVGADAGVFCSTDNGVNWTRTNIPVQAFAIARNGTYIFAATSGHGILRSANNGVSWSPANSGLTDSLVFVPNNARGNIFAGTRSGVFRSTDNGVSWASTNTGFAYTPHIYSFATSGAYLFAGTSVGQVYRSTDYGLTWSRPDSSSPGHCVISLVANGGDLFAGTLEGGIFHSTNYGTNWTRINSGVVSDTTSVAALSISGTRLIAGAGGGPFGDKGIFGGNHTHGIFVSTNNGVNWSETGSGLSDTFIGALAESGGEIFAGTGGGAVLLSTDNGVNWNAVSSVTAGVSMYEYGFAASGENLFVGTWTSGVYFTSDDGATWAQINEGLPSDLVNALLVSGSNLFAGTNYNGVYLSTNSGASWIPANNGFPNPSLNVNCFSANGAAIYAGTGIGVFVSTNNGAGWTGLTSSPQSMIYALAATGSNILAGASGGIYRSTDNGTTWNKALNLQSTTCVWQFAVSGTYIYAGISTDRESEYGVYRSTDNGATWVPSRAGLPTAWDVNSIAVSGEDIFAGTFGGVFLSTDQGASWSPMNSGLADTTINALTINDNYLFAGTYDNGGVWRYPLYGSPASRPNWVVLDTSDGMLDLNVHSIMIDSAGIGWVGTDNGFGRFDGKSWTTYSPYNTGLPAGAVYAITSDAQGNKWLGTGGGGLVMFDGTTWSIYNMSTSGLPNNYVYAVAVGPHGNKWIGTEGGFAELSGSTWTNYNSTNSNLDLTGENIRSILIDGQGTKWVGTWDKGLLKFDGLNSTEYDPSNCGMGSYIVQSIALDKQGKMWLGTDNGLTVWDGTNWTTYIKTNSGLTNTDVNAVAVDTAGNIWFGTQAGLGKFDGTNWTMYYTTNSGLPGDVIQALAIDAYGNIWIGTDNGLAIFNENGVVNGVKQKIDRAPVTFALSQNYPNPFNPTTLISYRLSVRSHVTLKVYDILGREVRTLVSGDESAGTHTIRFDGSGLSSGVYLYRLVAGSHTATRKLVLIR
ncbi:MAG: T9SS type A sorting domain-containing protein [Bacteroidetes bacterium]|nr:T9SS type A sorting domain-containing protein [Bacteroidota bacterium]